MANRSYIPPPQSIKLNRANSLTRELVFAYTTHMDKGFRKIGSDYRSSSPDLITGVYPLWIGTPETDNYETKSSMGRLVEGGVSGAGLSLRWPTTGNKHSVTGRGFTAFVVWEPDNIVSGNNQRIFRKRLGHSSSNPGWDIYVASNGEICAQVCNGSTELNIQSGVFAVTRQTYTTVLRHTGSTVAFFVDGIRRVQQATSTQIGSTTDPVRLFYDDDNPDDFIVEAGCAYIWRRAISNAEVSRLNRDPYEPFRMAPNNRNLFGLASIGSSGSSNSFFLAF